jgi:protein-S-isoprenylcysteine O-methyltransferase Ste14
MTIHDAPIRIIIPAMWLAWAALWTVAAFTTKATQWQESLGSRARHDIPFLICIVLLTVPGALPEILRTQFLPMGNQLALLGSLVVAAGLGLAVWARWHLGRNWSSTVTLKEGHTLVQSGPYRTIRHPIYTGLLLALVGTAASIGEWRGVLAVACAFIGVRWKIRVEEDRMRRTFPQYEQYRKATSALLPLLY